MIQFCLMILIKVNNSWEYYIFEFPCFYVSSSSLLCDIKLDKDEFYEENKERVNEAY